jgi:hypothetical protein
LRRALLQPGKSYRVLDCFSGSEVIWSTLRQEYEVADYLALDIKAKRGRLKMDSLRFVREKTESAFDVVDLDAYGAPWDHWEAVLNWHRPLTVFLTVGAVGLKAASKTSLRMAGLPVETPIGMHAALQPILTDFCLAKCYDHV